MNEQVKEKKKGAVVNRDAFLNRIADKLGRERKTTVQKPDWTFQPQWEVFADHSKDELLEVFKKSAEAAHSRVYETTFGELAVTLANTIKEYGGGPIIAGADPRFAEYGLQEVLASNEVSIWEPRDGRTNIDLAAESRIGLSISDMTLAESGTAVFFNDKNKARSINLLPITSVIIVPKSSLVPRLTQAAQEIGNRVRSGAQIESYINMVSGPSNSADIEMNLVVGVHGPVKVVYLVVSDR